MDLQQSKDALTPQAIAQVEAQRRLLLLRHR